jgi:hypothetical protein
MAGLEELRDLAAAAAETGGRIVREGAERRTGGRPVLAAPRASRPRTKVSPATT